MNPQIMQRISITVDESLAQAFDELIAKRGYQNRSEAFRDLLKKELAQEALVNPSQECVAVVSYTYATGRHCCLSGMLTISTNIWIWSSVQCMFTPLMTLVWKR